MRSAPHGTIRGTIRRRRRRRLAAVAWAAVVLAAGAACGDATGPRDELSDARARWRASRPDAYAFTLQVGCFCIAEVTSPVIVEVHGTTVVSRRYEATGESVDARWAAAFPSVDGLFEVIESAVAGGADRLHTEYDPTRGFPREIFVDYYENMADDEMAYVVRDLRAL